MHVGAHAFATGPLLVGLLHGLAGSGALTALALSQQPSSEFALLSLVLYAAGAAVGMALLAGSAGLTFSRLRGAWPSRVLALAGCLSLMTGVVWAAARLG